MSMVSYIELENTAAAPDDILHVIPVVDSINNDTINQIITFDFQRMIAADKTRLFEWQSKRLNVTMLVNGDLAVSSPLDIIPLKVTLHNGDIFTRGYITDIKMAYKNLRRDPTQGTYGLGQELLDGSITIQYM